MQLLVNADWCGYYLFCILELDVFVNTYLREDLRSFLNVCQTYTGDDDITLIGPQKEEKRSYPRNKASQYCPSQLREVKSYQAMVDMASGMPPLDVGSITDKPHLVSKHRVLKSNERESAASAGGVVATTLSPRRRFSSRASIV
jgi:hypothetical protein